MGAFKPLLPFGNQTVIETCIDYLHRGGAEPIVVVLGHRAVDVQEQLKTASVKFSFNSDPESEMNASIRAGVEELPVSSKATLIALADHPAVPPTVVSQLIAEWQNGSSLIIPTWQDRGGHPVLIDLRFRQELQTLDPNLGLKSLFTTHRNEVKRLPVNSPFIARDIDKWDDYLDLYTEVFGHAPPVLPPRRD